VILHYYSLWYSRNGRGTQLFLCSSDGTIAFVEFTKEEIGTALSDDEKVLAVK